MAIQTSAQPLGGTARSRQQAGRAGRPRIVSAPLALVFLAEFCSLTSFYLLLSVTPRYASAAGAGSAGAGLVTGILLLGTIAAELAAPMLLHHVGHRTLLVAGSVLLGAPALALLRGGGFGSMVAVSAVRGFGFGLSTVIAGALTASLVPPERRGEGLGLFGIVATAPGVIALPAGLWLASRWGLALVAGLAAVTALIPLVAFCWLPGRRSPGGSGALSERPDGLMAGLRRPGQLGPFLVFAASTVAAGVVVSFLPLAIGVASNVAAAGLLAQAVTATISRWLAGRHGDRRGHAQLLVPALVIAAAGMVTMVWLASPTAVIAGMCLFGMGFGICQNATFALMVARMPAAGAGTASALWNLAYDAGYGTGPAVFGLFVAHTGFPAAFLLTGVLMVAALPTARRERSARATPVRRPG